MKKILYISLILTGLQSLSAQTAETPRSYAPMVSSGRLLGAIPALRDLEPQTQPRYPAQPKTWHKRNHFPPNQLNNPDALPRQGDPIVQAAAPDRNGGAIEPTLNFDGLRDENVTPPDPTGDIGQNHYVQMVNSSDNSWFQVWDKQGKSVYGPTLTSTIWSEVGTSGGGDPIIQYDHAAGRWIILELQGLYENFILLAISDTDDPGGSWKAYSIATLGFPDYPKFYVWNNAYMITVNEIVNGRNACSGYALERDKMLAGDHTFKAHRFEMPNHRGIAYQPATGADWEGGPPPPPGSPGYIFRVYDDGWNGGDDHLQVWELYVNWQDSTQSHLDGPQMLFPEPFETKVCYQGLFDCIEQPDSDAPRITALENIIMYRAPYRNFGAHESVVLNHISDISNQKGLGGDAAVRWYELRKTAGGPWKIYQQSTFAPDKTNRFTGTLSMDAQGNIALGYTAASETVLPGIRLTGRKAGDPLNEMTLPEYELVAGESSHYDSRWGDYSNMAVDPADGRTFWFTAEYQPANVIWGTRIGSFQITRDDYDVSPQSLVSPVESAGLGAAEKVQVRIVNQGLNAADGVSVRLIFDGTPVAEETLNGTLAPGATLLHTFVPTVSMSNFGASHTFEIITVWPKDQFARNDTLRTTVRKPTAHDAALVGKTNLFGASCAAHLPFGLIVRNTGVEVLQSLKIGIQVNAQPVQTTNWSGNLQPGARDTVLLLLSGLNDGPNQLRLFSSQPNGFADQNTTNDSLQLTVNGYFNTGSVSLETRTDFGVLQWELRTPDNMLLAAGELRQGDASAEICVPDNACYRLLARSGTFAWQGLFRLRDFLGNVRAEFTYCTPFGTLQEFCTPARQQKDVGIVKLSVPVTAVDLTATEPVTVAVRNFGLTAQTGISAAWRLKDGVWHTETVPGTVPAGATLQHTFDNTADLSTVGGRYEFQLNASVPGDQTPGNDGLNTVVYHRAPLDAEVRSIRIDACQDTAFLRAQTVVFNNGIQDIKELTIHTFVNGVAQEQTIIQTNIAPGATRTLFLPVYNSLFGANTFSMEIAGVNGQGKDYQTANDEFATTFLIDRNLLKISCFISLDEKPWESSWELTDEANKVLYSGKNYQRPFEFASTSFCVPKGCYRFRLNDSGGDGMDGNVSLFISGGSFLWGFNGGNFGYLTDTLLCACADFQMGLDVTQPADNSSLDGKITITPSGGEPPYRFALNGQPYQSSPDFDSLQAGIYKVLCRDDKVCIIEKPVQLGTVAAPEPQTSRQLDIGPNPTDGLVWISLRANSGEQRAVCEIFDAEGRPVRNAPMRRWNDELRGIFSLETQAAGLYFLRVRLNGETLVGRLLKAR